MAGLTPKITVPTVELPDGYRLWHPGDDDRPTPVLSPTARYGLVGTFLELIDGQTEAGIAAVGAIVLAQLGTLIGRRAVVRIGEHRHHANLFELIIGDTSTGGKGSADTAAERLTEAVEPGFFVRHAMGGFGSGEAIVEAIRDTDPDEDANEKRRVINEAEFSAVLRVARRESSILSEIIRQGFDYKPIRHRTKASGVVISTGHHLAVVGSITPIEMLRCSSELDVENGWLNRFLLMHAEIERVLPFGGAIDDTELTEIVQHVRKALARLAGTGIDGTAISYRIEAATDTGELWEPWYRRVRFGSGEGRVRSLTRRQHVQAARLALIFAVLDEADEIKPAHLEAATAWTDYSVATAERYFGSGPGGQAGKLLDAIRRAMPDGLTTTDQHAVFGRHIDATALEVLRHELEAAHHVFSYELSTGGRPKIVSVAITAVRTNEETEESP
jgi:putative DNA primase/helicase